MASSKQIPDRTPQFTVRCPTGGGSFGTQVLFNGEPIANVANVKVSSQLDVDDVVRSTLTIELVGEIVLVETGKVFIVRGEGGGAGSNAD